MSDPVNPEHYKLGDIECIAAIRASMSTEAFKGYLKGNNLFQREADYCALEKRQILSILYAGNW